MGNKIKIRKQNFQKVDEEWKFSIDKNKSCKKVFYKKFERSNPKFKSRKMPQGSWSVFLFFFNINNLKV